MRILLPLWTDGPQRCFYQDFHQGLIEALLERGHEAIGFPFAQCGRTTHDEAVRLCQQVVRNPVRAVIDLACWGYALTGITIPLPNGKRERLFDAIGADYLGLLVDQPFNQPINSVAASRIHVAYPDRSHPAQMRLVYPERRFRGEVFSPPAVRLQNDLSAPKWSTNRDIDVLYIGNLDKSATQRFWHDRMTRQWPTDFQPKFCDAVADVAIDAPEQSLPMSVNAAIDAFGGLPPRFDFFTHLRTVEFFLRQRIRQLAVDALANSGVRMRIIGKGWDHLRAITSVELGAGTDYEGFFNLAGRAKVCLDASTYLDGVNDRVFSYALNRAVCFTNASGYLRPTFGEQSGTRFYSMHDLPLLGEQVKSVLARPAALEAEGECAKQTVLGAHTWRHRVDSLFGSLC